MPDRTDSSVPQKPNYFKGPILYCFSLISHSCQRSNNTLFDMHCPKPIRGPEFQLSKSCSSELHWEQVFPVPAPLNAYELLLCLACYMPLSGEKMLVVACASLMVDVYISLCVAEMLSFNHTSLTQNRTQKERLLKKYRLCGCSRMFQNG